MATPLPYKPDPVHYRRGVRIACDTDHGISDSNLVNITCKRCVAGLTAAEVRRAALAACAVLVAVRAAVRFGTGRRRITEAEYAAALPRRMQKTADDLTAVLPDWAHEAGLRFDWTTGS